MTSAYNDNLVDLTGEPIRLLYLDDDPMLCRAFARVASYENIEVVTTTEPDEAIRHLEERTFHIVAVDYRMPTMTGVHFLECLREQLQDTYKIMVTGMCDFETVHAAINRAGVQRYVTKPWQMDELISILREAARSARLVMENRELQRRLQARNQELAIINEGLGRLARERTMDVLNALVAALDYRDTETQWHSRRVALFARMVATAMGYTGDALQDIELGAMLHDVGKIGISDTILLKPGKLTADEWDEMRKHPELGYKLLSGIDFLEGARQIVLQHHERWDGGGYPQKLVGEDIVVGARIFALCDTLDAITSDRPYRKGRDFTVARDEIVRHSGTQFDPAVTKAFLDIPEEHWRKVIAFGHAPEKQGSEGFIWSAGAELARMPGLAEAFTLLSVMRQNNQNLDALNKYLTV